MSAYTSCTRKRQILVNEKYIDVRCGKCIGCKNQKYIELRTRWEMEYKKAKSAAFVTITYHDRCLPTKEVPDHNGELRLLSTLHKPDFKKYLHRIRDMHAHACKKNPLPDNWPKMIYIMSGEYGHQTKRPHGHLLILNCHPEVRKKIRKTWKFGITHQQDLTSQGIDYVLKDLNKQNTDDLGLHESQEPPFQLQSNGVGMSYVNQFKNYHLDNRIFTMKIPKLGAVGGLPRYVKRKIFGTNYLTEDETEQMLKDSLASQMEDAKKSLESGFLTVEDYQINLEETKERKRKFFGKKTL